MRVMDQPTSCEPIFRTTTFTPAGVTQSYGRLWAEKMSSTTRSGPSSNAVAMSVGAAGTLTRKVWPGEARVAWPDSRRTAGRMMSMISAGAASHLMSGRAGMWGLLRPGSGPNGGDQNGSSAKNTTAVKSPDEWNIGTMELWSSAAPGWVPLFHCSMCSSAAAPYPTRSNTVAMPWPPPMQRLTSP